MIVTRGFGSNLIITQGYGSKGKPSGGRRANIYINIDRKKISRDDEEILFIIMNAVNTGILE